MRFGHYNNLDLEGCATLREWVLNKIALAEITVQAFEEIVFIVPITNTRFRLADSSGIEPFKKKVSKCVGLGPTATKNAIKLRGAKR